MARCLLRPFASLSLSISARGNKLRPCKVDFTPAMNTIKVPSTEADAQGSIEVSAEYSLIGASRSPGSQLHISSTYLRTFGWSSQGLNWRHPAGQTGNPSMSSERFLSGKQRERPAKATQHKAATQIEYNARYLQHLGGLSACFVPAVLK